MTPKEKAKELFDKFYGIEPVEPIYIGMDKGQAKQSALICVDEMLGNYEEKYKYCKSKQFLEEVKQEINKL
tara:strand:- start:345 stop:557 length:213 start_codon:yes stop_codon:yes gene_type:complete